MTNWGDQQNRWMHDTLDEWSEDGSILYKVMVSHFPIWSVAQSTPMDFFAAFNTDLLPLLRDNNFDLYLSAHDNLTAFANIKYADSITTKTQPKTEQVVHYTEYWFGSSDQEKLDRFKGFDQR